MMSRKTDASCFGVGLSESGREPGMTFIATSPLVGYAFTPLYQKAYKLPSFIDGFLVDAPVYPGSSGSAVVIKPQPMSYDSPGGVMAGGPRSITYVLGLISDSIPIADFDG